jgi:2-polyprenyl-6-hydroxyphenyl methylase/3-demethylubiquinone-9 3-methyltransferase
MSYLADLRDWLGGWPYEDAKIEDVLRFCRKKLNLELINIATGEANTEYLFRTQHAKG